MTKTRKTLALIYGGRGYESEVSLHGAENIRPIIEKKYNCLPIFIDKGGRWLAFGKDVFPYKRGFYCPEGGEHFKCDCAIPLLHGDFGEDGIVQGALECASVTYVGCRSTVGAICRDKSILKAVAEKIGIPTLLYLTAKRGERVIKRAESELGYPMFVKPACLGSSVGASPARDRGELVFALKNAFAVSSRVIIERLLEPKRELECGYFRAKGKELFTKCGEILAGGEFYDYDSKYKNGTEAIPKAEVAPWVNEKIREYSRRLVSRLGIDGLCRIDFFLSGEDIYFNEINTMPGMTAASLYMKMLSAEGISPEEMIDLLVLDATER